MEQIANYFEAMDYVSFGAVALPCVVIAYAVYGILQVVSGKQCKSKFPSASSSGSAEHTANKS